MHVPKPLLLLPVLTLVAALAAPAPALATQPDAGPFRLELALDESSATLPLALLDRDLAGGGDMAADVAPILAFILGIVPGFGIGHLVAGDGDGFVTWLVIDLLVTAVAIITPLSTDFSGFVDSLFYIAALALRVVEGFSAMEAAQANWVWIEPGPEAPAFAGALHVLQPVPAQTWLRF